MGQAVAILVVFWEDIGATWVYAGAILGNVGAILGQLLEIVRILWQPYGKFGFRVSDVEFGV